MKEVIKFFVSITLILYLVSPVKAKDDSDQSVIREERERNRIESTLIGISVGDYYVSAARFKRVYGKHDLMYGFGLTQKIVGVKHHNIALSIEAKYFEKKGASTVTKEETKITLMPLSLTARYLLQIKNFIPFIGAGYDYFSYKERSALHNTKGYTHGYHILGGFYFQIPGAKFLKLNLFSKFTQASTTENDIKVDLGGFEAGMGLAFGFNLF